MRRCEPLYSSYYYSRYAHLACVLQIFSVWSHVYAHSDIDVGSGQRSTSHKPISSTSCAFTHSPFFINSLSFFNRIDAVQPTPLVQFRPSQIGRLERVGRVVIGAEQETPNPIYLPRQPGAPRARALVLLSLTLALTFSSLTCLFSLFLSLPRGSKKRPPARSLRYT